MAVVGGVLATPGTGRAGEPDDGDGVPVPEPILAETITDVDGSEAGEIELEANGSLMRAARGGAFAADSSLEMEWLVTRLLGLRVEPTLSRDGDGSSAGTQAGVSGGASWKLLQDFQRQLHVQAEVVGRAPWDESPIIQPGDPALPVAFDVRAALRRGPLTMRGSAGVGFGGSAVGAPLRASAALMAPFEETGRIGYWGVELDVDGARRTPLLVALDLVPNFAPAGIPLRLGLALPWSIGAPDDRPSLGLFLRVFYESAREIAFAAPRSRE